MKTFYDLTGTSVSHIHKKEKWNSYLHCIANNLTLRQAAKQVGVSFRASFMWRHKIIGAFKDMGCTNLKGIIEGDEAFFLFSEKGNSQWITENHINVGEPRKLVLMTNMSR